MQVLHTTEQPNAYSISILFILEGTNARRIEEDAAMGALNGQWLVADWNRIGVLSPTGALLGTLPFTGGTIRAMATCASSRTVGRRRVRSRAEIN